MADLQMTACPSPHLPSASCPTCARGAYDTTDLWKAAMVARAIVQETIASPEPLVWALTTVVCLMTSWGRVGPLAKAVGQALVNYLLWHRCDKTVEGVRNGAWVHPRELRCLRCVSRCCCGQQVKVTGASRAIVVTLSATMSSGAVCSWDCAVSVHRQGPAPAPLRGSLLGHHGQASFSTVTSACGPETEQEPASLRALRCAVGAAAYK